MSIMLRTVLLVVGVLIILGIAFDGWRRKQRRLKLTRQAHRTTVSPLDESIQESEGDTPAIETVSAEAFSTVENETVEEEIVSHPEPVVAPDNVHHAETVFCAEPKSGPTPVDIKPLEKQEPSANQKLPEKAPIKPETVKSANQRLPDSAKQETKVEEKPVNVISLTIMAHNTRPFAGYDIIRTLQENHLHHGAYDIYHRHKYRNGKGPLYFSVASIIKPGTINPRKVGELSTPGLALFMELDNPKHDRVVFKQALATAHQIAKSLGGVVCDNRRVPLRESSLQAYADKIKL